MYLCTSSPPTSLLPSWWVIFSSYCWPAQLRGRFAFTAIYWRTVLCCSVRALAEPCLCFIFFVALCRAAAGGCGWGDDHGVPQPQGGQWLQGEPGARHAWGWKSPLNSSSPWPWNPLGWGSMCQGLPTLRVKKLFLSVHYKLCRITHPSMAWDAGLWWECEWAHSSVLSINLKWHSMESDQQLKKCSWNLCAHFWRLKLSFKLSQN